MRKTSKNVSSQNNEFDAAAIEREAQWSDADLKAAMATTPEGEAKQSNRRHLSADLPAGSQLVIEDPILHVANMTFKSGQILLNAVDDKFTEGHKTIKDPAILEAMMIVLEQLREAGTPPVLTEEEAKTYNKGKAWASMDRKIVDGEGLFQLKYTYAELAVRPESVDNIGYVHSDYMGKYAHNVVGLKSVQDEIADHVTGEDETDFDKGNLIGWWSIRWDHGAHTMKLQRKLHNLDAKANESDAITQMRKTISRNEAFRLIYQAESTHSSLLMDWSNNYNFGYLADFWFHTFQKPTKEAFLEGLVRIEAKKAYKTQVRLNVAANEQAMGVRKPVERKVIESLAGEQVIIPVQAKVVTTITLVDGQVVDLTTLVGKHIRFFTKAGALMPMQERVITAANAEIWAMTCLRQGLAVEVIS